MRDSRAAQLRSIRLTNVNHFVNYAEAITTRANELALLGDTSFSQNERKRILLSGMLYGGRSWYKWFHNNYYQNYHLKLVMLIDRKEKI